MSHTDCTIRFLQVLLRSVFESVQNSLRHQLFHHLEVLQTPLIHAQDLFLEFKHSGLEFVVGHRLRGRPFVYLKRPGFQEVKEPVEPCMQYRTEDDERIEDRLVKDYIADQILIDARHQLSVRLPEMKVGEEGHAHEETGQVDEECRAAKEPGQLALTVHGLEPVDD